MNSSPIDTYDGAAEIFTFGANSTGVWIFLIVSVVLFIGLMVRVARHESHSFASLGSEPMVPPSPEGDPRASSGIEPMAAAIE